MHNRHIIGSGQGHVSRTEYARSHTWLGRELRKKNGARLCACLRRPVAGHTAPHARQWRRAKFSTMAGGGGAGPATCDPN